MSTTIVCDGIPSMMGCPSRVELKRRWTTEGKKPNGWLVDHATEDIWGTPTRPLYLLYFCPSCAPIVLAQIEKQEVKS